MFFLASMGRGVYARWLRGARMSGRFCRPVILVGDNDEARELYELTVHHPNTAFASSAPSAKRAAFVLPQSTFPRWGPSMT